MPVTLGKPEQKTIAPVQRQGRRHWLLQTVLWLAGTLLALELLFAIAGVGEQESLMPHPTFGYDPIPSKPITWRKEGFARLQFNSQGMQDIERSPAKPAGVKRIAVLGDSFVEALQVDRSQNFCNRLERKLHSDPATAHWEVLNFGVSNASLSQMYLRLKNKVRKFSPDVVAIEFPVDATFQFIFEPRCSFLQARPFFYVDGTGLHEDHQLMNMWRNSPEGMRYRVTAWLRANSRIWGVISNCVEQGAGWWQGLETGRKRWGSELANANVFFPTANKGQRSTAGKQHTVGNKQLTPEQLTAAEKQADQYYWPIADALFKEIKAECDAQKCKLVVIRFSRSQKKDNVEESRLLRETANRYGFPIIDAVPAFSSAKDRGEQLFYDQHFNPEGHSTLTGEIFKQGKAIHLFD